MARVKLFIKANVDVYDSLHSCRLGGQVVWNGINEVVRERFPGTLVRLHHETSSGFRSICEADGVTPEEVTDRAHLLGFYPPASQFSAAIFETDADAIVLSIQSDLQACLRRHRRLGYLFHAAGASSWPAADRRWLTESFAAPDELDLGCSMRALERLVARIRLRTAAPILVYNLSTAIPGERIHCFQGFENIFSTHIRRFNLGLIELSERIGISIIDVDGVLARAGADRMHLDAIHLTREGYRLVAEEVVRVLTDLSVLDEGVRP